MKDITSWIEECAASLTYKTPLIQNDSFSLLDSMAALELMDPKMDCCENLSTASISTSTASTSTAKSTSTSTSTSSSHSPMPYYKLSLHRLKWRDLTLSDVEWISMQALVRLEAYLDAANVAESTYTCLYMHDAVLRDMKHYFLRELHFDPLHSMKLKLKLTPSTASASASASASTTTTTTICCQLALFAMALTVVKLTEQIRMIVQNADIYEEEDFTPNAYSFLFFPGVSSHNVTVCLNHAISHLQAFIISSDDKNNDTQDKVHASSLQHMLSYLLHFYKSCVLLHKMSKDNVRDRAHTVQTLAQQGIQHLTQIQTPAPIQTHSDASHDTNHSNNNTQQQLLLHQCFNPLINRHLLGNAPVRQITLKDPAKVLDNLSTTFQQLSTHLCDLLLHANTLSKLQCSLSYISLSKSNILTRSLIVLHLYFDDLILGQHNLSKMIAQSMQLLCATPASLLFSSNDASNTHSNKISHVNDNYSMSHSFLNRLGKPIYDICKVLLLNRNRQRPYIESIILKEWAHLQHESQKLDYYLRPPPNDVNPYPSNATSNHSGHNTSSSTTISPPLYMTHYVLSHTLNIMEHYIGLSIELQLWKGGTDASMVYWYLDFILSTQLSVWTRMKHYQMEQMIHHQNENHNNKTNHNHNINVHNKELEEEDPSIHVNMEFMLLTLRRNLCRGIVRFLAALQQANYIKTPQYKFTSHAQRFQKRFELFAQCQLPQPPVLSYNDYLQGSDFSQVSSEDLILSASDCFKSAKHVIDKILETMNLYEHEHQRQQQTYKNNEKDEKSIYQMMQQPIQKEEVMRLAKVCVGNSLFLHQFHQLNHNNSKKMETKKVVLDFTVHDQFCTIKLE